ncbi:MAG: hypothetical protein EP344_17210, partial [Bacteroidetes bacterium]
MKTIQILLPFLCLFYLGCETGTPADRAQQSTDTTTDALKLRAGIDSLWVLAEATTNGKDTLLLAIADLYKALRDDSAWCQLYQKDIYSYYRSAGNYEAASRALEKAVRDIWWPDDARAGTLYAALGYAYRKTERNYVASIALEKAR